MFRCVPLALTLATLLTGHAWAILDKNSTANTTDPMTGLPWGNLGSFNGGGGIYLGNRWVLSPAHVYFANGGAEVGKIITFGLESFVADSGPIYLQNPITNPPTEVNSDMVLFHLSSAPSLSPLAISTLTPTAGTQVYFVGFGHTRGEAATFGSYTGFAWSTITKSWGTNRVNTSGVTTNYHTETFQTTFNSGFGSTADEAQATVGDSGAGVFVYGTSGWALAGSVDTIATVDAPGRDPYAYTVYGDVTNSADLATYRAQILAVTSVPEPGAGLLCGLLLPLALRRARARR